MPSTPTSDCVIDGTVTRAYKSGLKLDGAWREYAPACPKIDARPGDRVRISLDANGCVAQIALLERGTGEVAPEAMTPGQKDLILKLLDDRECSVGDFGDFFRKLKGKEFEALTKIEAGSFINFLFGRERAPLRRRRQG